LSKLNRYSNLESKKNSQLASITLTTFPVSEISAFQKLDTQ